MSALDCIRPGVHTAGFFLWREMNPKLAFSIIIFWRDFRMIARADRWGLLRSQMATIDDMW